MSETVVVKAYLLASVRRRIARLNERDTVFRQTTSLGSVEFALHFTVEDQLIADEETAAKVTQLNRLVNALPPRQKEALYLRYNQGLTIAQIATIPDINDQSATNLLHRAVRHLRTEWTGDLTLALLLIAGLV